MRVRSTARALLFVIAATALTPPVTAAIQRTGASVGGGFGPSGRAEKHPKSAVARQELAALAATADYRLCAGYERPPGRKDAKGSLSARVEVRRDGNRVAVVQIPKAGVAGGRARTCATLPVQLEETDLLDWSFQFKGMPKVPAGQVVSFRGEVIAAEGSFGSFLVTRADGDQTVLWTGDANLVFCRTDAGFADLWIRLAADDRAGGEDAAHLDIDVCNLAGGGRFSPFDPQNPGCGSAKTFDLFWHEEDGDFYRNRTDTRGCELVLVADGAGLEGTFACPGLVMPGGSATVDVLGGALRCEIE